MATFLRFLAATFVALIALVLAAAPRALAQPGALDTSFGTNGTTLIGFGDGRDESRVVAPLANGSYLVGGSAGPDLVLVRYLSSGAPDPSFGQRGVARLPNRYSAVALDLDVQFDGRIVVVGRDLVGPFVTRFLADGAFDPTFGVGGFAELSSVPGLSLAAIRVVTGDRILLAGSINGATATGSFAVCRLTPSGALDPAFDGDGLQSTTIPNGGSATSMTIQSDGKIVLAGRANNAGSGSSLALVRYTAAGALDTSLDGDGRVITTIVSATASSFANAVVTQAVSGNADKLLVAGSTTVSPTNREGVLARYNLNGTLDATFGSGGVVVQAISTGDDDFRALRFVPGADRTQPSRIFVGGYASFPTSQRNVLLCSYGITGSLNTGFSGDGIVVETIGTSQNEAASMAFTGERLLVTGLATQGTEGQNFMLARFLASNGALDFAFDGDGKRLDDLSDAEAWAAAAARQADGRIVVAGASRSGTLPVVARVNANGSLDSTFSGDARVVVATGGGATSLTDVVVQADQKIVVAGTTILNAHFLVTVARLLSDGSPDPSFGGTGTMTLPLEAREELTPLMALQPDGRLLLACATYGLDYDLTRVVRLLPSGQLDPSFGAAGSVMVGAGGDDLTFMAFTLQPDGRSIVVGRRRRPPNVLDIVVVRLTASGALDTTFGTGGVATIFPDADHAPAKVLVQSDGRIVVTGALEVSAGNRDPWVLRLMPNGQPDGSYGLQGYRLISGVAGDEGVYGATLQSFDRLLLAAGAGPASLTNPLIRRLTNAGNLDPTFSGDGAELLDLGASALPYDILPDVVGSPILMAGQCRSLMSISAIQPGMALAGVDDAPDARSPSLALAAPWPNPSRGVVTLALRLGAPSSLNADVLDVQGRHVRVLAEGESFAAGEARLRWDGRDAEGRLAAAGLYFVRVRTERGVVTRRIVLAR